MTDARESIRLTSFVVLGVSTPEEVPGTCSPSLGLYQSGFNLFTLLILMNAFSE